MAKLMAFPRVFDTSQEQQTLEPAELAPVQAEQWRQLCLHTHYWFARFCHKLDVPRRERWLTDPALRGAMPPEKTSLLGAIPHPLPSAKNGAPAPSTEVSRLGTS